MQKTVNCKILMVTLHIKVEAKNLQMVKYVCKKSIKSICLTEKVVILLGHDGPEKIPRSTILLNKRTELLQKCRHKRKFTYAGFKTRKWDYECPGNPTGTEEEIQ